MDNQTTPKKVYLKEKLVSQGYCRLCGCMNETRHMTNVICTAAKEKFIVEVIAESCEISIENSDGLSPTVCRKCMNFVNKIHHFREKRLHAQEDLKERVSVKRCPVQSPRSSKANPSKWQATSLQATSLQVSSRQGNNVKYNLQAKSKLDFSSTSQSHFGNEACSLPETNLVASETSTISSTITTGRTDIITAAANTNDAAVFAEVVIKNCPGIVEMIMKLIAIDLQNSCQSLCHRNNGSVLHTSREDPYGVMKFFSFATLWKEIETNIPFVIDVFNAVTGVEPEKAKQDLQAKYGFLYSVLMNTRWHENQTKGRGFDSHRGRADFSACLVWDMHSE